jgi:hypothetical protein
MNRQNSYTQIIEKIFFRHYQQDVHEVPFDRKEIIEVAHELGISLPKNLGDVVYSFRYRASLPESIRNKAPSGCVWVIRPAGQSKYKFMVARFSTITPSELLAETKIPNATPGVIESYALSDEQALLAKVRYNRLIDIFTGIACYSLQSHLRTNVPGLGQVETDEIYVGIDKRGSHYVIPVQAKGSSDKLGIIQIEQDIAVCKLKFPNLICRPVATQFMTNNLIAMFEFESIPQQISIISEKHYRLVSPEELTDEDLRQYQNRKEE